MLENTDIPMQPSVVFWFVPEATVIRAVLLADGNFVCILKTEAQEKVVYSSACSEKAASLPRYSQKLLAYSTDCSDYLAAFFTGMQIFNHLLALQASRSMDQQMTEIYASYR